MCEDDARALVARGALFAVHSSGGKDSQAMLLRVAQVVPPSQLIVVHETLGVHEYPDALEHVRAQVAATVPGVEVIVAAARTKGGASKSFFDLVDDRARKRPHISPWPFGENRQCTSDLKRDPGDREVKRYAAARGLRLIVTCMGMRAEESPGREAMPALARYNRGCTRDRTFKFAAAREGREWWTWLPVQHLLHAEVFATIHEAGQRAHWIYYAAADRPANDRFSCVFCIFGSPNDLRNGAILHPALYAQYVAREIRYGFTLSMSRKSLIDLTGLTPEAAWDEHRRMRARATEAA